MSLFACLVLSATAAVSAMQRALDTAATWTMERQLPGASRTLVSSGTVTCHVGQGILWQVAEPFASSVEMTTNAMIFVDEDGRRVKNLDELPHYADIRAATDAFAAGKKDAFDGVFSIEETVCDDGGWKVVLTPEISAIRQLVEKVEILGASLPTNAVLTTGKGGRSTIRFKELERVR